MSQEVSARQAVAVQSRAVEGDHDDLAAVAQMFVLKAPMMGVG